MSLNETPKAIQDHFTSAVEELAIKAPNDIAKDLVRITTKKELNALSFRLLERQKTQSIVITQELRSSIEARLKALQESNNQTTDIRLDQLESRLNFMQELLSANSSPNPTYKPSFFSNFTQNVTNSLTSTFDLVGRMPIPRPVQRIFYTALTFPQFLPGGQYLGQSMIDAGKKNLALMDIQDFVRQHQGFTFDTRCTDIEWNRFVKSGKDIAELVSTYMTIASTPGAGNELKTVSMAKLLNVDGIKAARENEATNALIARMMQNDTWKIDGKAPHSIRFGAETSWKDGALTVNRTDVADDGSVIDGSTAAALMEARKNLPNINELTIGTDPKINLSWRMNKKIAQIPREGTIALEMINEIIAHPKPDQLSTIEIADTYTQKPNEVVRTSTVTDAKLSVRNNEAVIAALASQLSTFEDDGRWIYKNGSFARITPVTLSA